MRMTYEEITRGKNLLVEEMEGNHRFDCLSRFLIEGLPLWDIRVVLPVIWMGLRFDEDGKTLNGFMIPSTREMLDCEFPDLQEMIDDLALLGDQNIYY